MPLCLLQHMIAMIPAAGPLFTGNAASSLGWSGIIDMWVSCWNRPKVDLFAWLLKLVAVERLIMAHEILRSLDSGHVTKIRLFPSAFKVSHNINLISSFVLIVLYRRNFTHMWTFNIFYFISIRVGNLLQVEWQIEN